MERNFGQPPRREIWFRSISIGPLPVLWWPIGWKGLAFLVLLPFVTVASLVGAIQLFPQSDYDLMVIPIMLVLYVLVIARHSED